jgi:very-short-patch-repair endonuclease
MDENVKRVIDELGEAAGVAAEEDYLHVVDLIGRRCESPIESLLLAGLVYQSHVYGGGPSGAPAITFFRGERIVHPPFPSIGCVAQCDIGPYRLDFYIEGTRGGIDGVYFKLAIECDGHDFHERTKVQARRDRQKDRWLQSNGIAIFRFTGSEIWNNAETCVDQIDTFISEKYAP